MFAESLKKLLNNVADLVKLKTIITMEVLTALTIGFLNGMVPVEVYVSIATAIVTYYFTRKEDKTND